ncbi:MAG: hypothetical protein H6635_09660 [Anaerolineales bacterium]|nr:hypothetical protein [Anaerolineales bacterium]MCB9145624.1 hypothetical protein [Anaerolineales bacterium]
MSDREQDRLKRLRERQIADRDPLVKQRNVQRGISTKARRMRKPFKLSGAWEDLPHTIRMPAYGLLLGIISTLILPLVWASPYAIWAGVIILVLLILLGIVIGGSLDWRDDLKNNLR